MTDATKYNNDQYMVLLERRIAILEDKVEKMLQLLQVISDKVLDLPIDVQAR